MSEPPIDVPGSLAEENHQLRQWLSRLQAELAAIERKHGLKPDPEIVRRVHDLEPRLNDPTCRLVVVGRINTGKSTLINALIGAGVLSRNQDAETSTITRIRQGSGYSFTWTEKEAPHLEHREEATDLEDLRRKVYGFTGDQGRFRSAVEDLVVTLPANSWHLPEGVELIDTPGLADGEKERSERTMAYLGQADAILYTMTMGEGLDQMDQQSLEQVYVMLGQGQDRVFFAATKFDNVRGGLKAWGKPTLKGNQTHQELALKQVKLDGLKGEARTSLSERIFPTAAGAFLFVNPERMLEPAERNDPEIMAEARREFPGKFGLSDWTSESSVAQATGIAALRQTLSDFLAKGAIHAWSNTCRDQKRGLQDLVADWVESKLLEAEDQLEYTRSDLAKRTELRQTHEAKFALVKAEVEEIKANMGKIERLKVTLFQQIDQARDKALEELHSLRMRS